MCTSLFGQAVPGLFGVISVLSASGNFRKWMVLRLSLSVELILFQFQNCELLKDNLSGSDNSMLCEGYLIFGLHTSSGIP